MINIDIVHILTSMGYSQKEIRDLIRAVLDEPNDILFLSETPTGSYFDLVWESKPSESKSSYKPCMEVPKVTQGDTSTT